jgi:hypothetical protein
MVQMKLCQLLDRPNEATLDDCFFIIHKFELMRIFNIIDFKLSSLRLCFEKLFENGRYRDAIQTYLYISYLKRANHYNDEIFQRFYDVINERGTIPDEYYEILHCSSSFIEGGYSYSNYNISFLQNLISLFRVLELRVIILFNFRIKIKTIALKAWN